MAPRVHNSGHLTIEACNVSQFESHVRAVCGLPLKDIEVVRADLYMENVIGEKPPQLSEKPLVARYDYHKEPRPGRKCGHLVLQQA